MYSAQKKLAKDLWEAVDNDDVIKVRFLLGRGADPNHQLHWSVEWIRYKDHPPLHRACYKGYLEIVKTLVTHGARTDKGGGGRNNRTPLHYACQEGHKETVKYLIQEVGCSTGKYRKFKATLYEARDHNFGGYVEASSCVAYFNRRWHLIGGQSRLLYYPRLQAAQIQQPGI